MARGNCGDDSCFRHRPDLGSDRGRRGDRLARQSRLRAQRLRRAAGARRDPGGVPEEAEEGIVGWVSAGLVHGPKLVAAHRRPLTEQNTLWSTSLDLPQIGFLLFDHSSSTLAGVDNAEAGNEGTFDKLDVEGIAASAI